MPVAILSHVLRVPCRYEAKFISGLVRYLLKQGYTESGDITVLTPYLGQLFLLRDIVGRNSILHVQVWYHNDGI